MPYREEKDYTIYIYTQYIINVYMKGCLLSPTIAYDGCGLPTI